MFKPVYLASSRLASYNFALRKKSCIHNPSHHSPGVDWCIFGGVIGTQSHTTHCMRSSLTNQKSFHQLSKNFTKVVVVVVVVVCLFVFFNYKRYA